MSLVDLKTELKKRNAKVAGKKAVLVQRLQDYDMLFGRIINDPESAYKIVVPNPEHFRDVTSHSAMPSFTLDDLEAFCLLTERDNLKTSLNMYEEYFLISCRSAYKDGEYYITAVCASEMRKHLHYNIIVKLKDHVILEAQCECAAGAGPYGQCKHIIVLLYGMINFHYSKIIKLKASSTNTLQTFHQPKKTYTGNPVEAENLTLKFNDKKMKEMTKFDPRPSSSQTDESVKNYKQTFRSLIANYCGSQKKGTIPIAQIIKPANKQALYSDHRYLQKSPEEKYLDSIKLSEKELEKLESLTKTNKKEWHQQRKLRLQSSNFGKIIKQKTNLSNLARTLIQSTDLQTPAIKHGRKYEAEAIRKFEQITEKKVTKCGIVVHPDHQYLGSTPDGLIGQDEVLEVKCPYTARNKSISGDSVPFLYLCEKSGKLKLKETHDYYYQIQGQMFCSRRSTANLFVYTINDAYHTLIERDESFIKEMVENLKSFYDVNYKCVLLDRFLYDKRS